MNFLLWDALKGAGKTALKTAGTLTRFAWTVTKPLRYPFKLAWGGIKKGADIGNKAIDATEWSLRCTREAAKGVFWTGLGKSAFEITKGPLNFLKYNYVDNTRDVLGDVFTLKTPRNILKAPINAWKGLKEGISETRKNLGGVLKSAWALKPFQTINNVRKSVSSLIKTPFKAAWKPTRAIIDTPVQVAGNIGKSIYSYPKHLYNAPAHLVNGGKRVLNAPSVATSEMEQADKYHFKHIPGSLRAKYNTLKEKAGEQYVKYSGDAAPAKAKGGGAPASPMAKAAAAH